MCICVCGKNGMAYLSHHSQKNVATGWLFIWLEMQAGRQRMWKFYIFFFAHLLSLPTPHSVPALYLMHREKGRNSTEFKRECSILLCGIKDTMQFEKVIWGFPCSCFAVRLQVAVTQHRFHFGASWRSGGHNCVAACQFLICINMKERGMSTVLWNLESARETRHPSESQGCTKPLFTFFF